MIKLYADTVYHPVKGMNPDSNGVSARIDECLLATNIDITVSEIQVRKGTDLFGETSDSQPTVNIIKYHLYIHPIEGAQIFAFGLNNIYRYDVGTGWVSCINPLITTYTWNQWSITNFIDRNIGTTVVAAASIYTRPTDAYTDGAERGLFYYDPTAGSGELGQFEELQLNSDLLFDEATNTGMVLAAEGGIITGTVTNTPLLPGTFYLVVKGIGVVATAGLAIYDQLETPYNKLSPVDETQVIFGPNSFVELDTGNFSIEFTDASFNGLDLWAYYSYKDPVDYRPLYVSNYQNSLVLANTSEFLSGAPGSWFYFPWRVRWTEQLDMTVTRQRDYQELALDDISPILGMRALETTASSTIVGPLYFYKHNSIIRGTYNQNYNRNPDLPVPIFNFEIAFSEGIEATNTITSIEGLHFYLGRNDVYAFDGVHRRSITHDGTTGATRIQKAIFDELDLDTLQRCFGVYDEIDRKYMLFIRVKGTSTYPTKCYVYDIDLDAWTTYEYPETSAALDADFVPGNIIANLSGNIEDLPGDIDDLSGNTNKLLLLAMTKSAFLASARSGWDKLNTDDAVTYASSYITRDFFGNTLEEQDRIQKMYIEGFGGAATISYNPYYEFTNFEQENTVSFSTRYKRESYLPDVVSNNCRFLLSLTAGTQIRWLQVFSNKQEFTNE